MRPSRFSVVLPLLLMAALIGCGQPPAIQYPELEAELPDDWAALDSDDSLAAAPSDTLSLTWWTEFGDPGLDAAIDEAFAANPGLGAAAARVQIAAAASGITHSAMWPWLDISANGARRQQNFVGFPVGGGGVLSSTSTAYGLSLGASWELDIWGRASKAASAATADHQASAADYLGIRLTLAGQTAKAWFAVVEARGLLELAHQTVEAYENTVSSVRSRFERGLRPALDLRLGLADLATSRAIEDVRKQQLQQAVRRLETLLGRYPAGLLETVAELPDLDEPIPAGLPAELVGRRPDMLAAERRVAASGARVSSAKRALLPRISLTASTGTSTAALGDLLSGNFGVWSLAGNLLQPIFQGGRLRAQVRQAQGFQAEALAGYANAALNAFREVEVALAAEAILAEQEAHVGEAASQSMAAYRLADDRYRAGLTNLITLLDSQRRAASSLISHIQVKRARLDNRIDLILALGGGFSPRSDDVRGDFVAVDSVEPQASLGTGDADAQATPAGNEPTSSDPSTDSARKP